MLERLLDRISLDDDIDGSRSEIVNRALCRLMGSPLAQNLAQRFLSENVSAHVSFVPIEASRVVETDAGLRFGAVRGLTNWNEGRLQITLNEDYLRVDPAFRDRDLPLALGHELFGHGVWYARAARENILQGLHHHEKNEAYARLVTWIVDEELGIGRWRAEAQRFVVDPKAALSLLKSKMLYYALTFSSDEMREPIVALTSRLAMLRAQRNELDNMRDNIRSWLPVITHFVDCHDIDEERFEGLKDKILGEVDQVVAERQELERIIQEVERTLLRFEAETEQTSERYLQWVAQHRLIIDLEREVEELSQALRGLLQTNKPVSMDLVNKMPKRSGQIDFTELTEMYRRDREQYPGHWTT